MSANPQSRAALLVPRATYRLQFNEHFRLRDAIALVPYLSALGVSHIYASPLFLARPHGTHGYDVCDFNRLNPELGTEEELRALVETLHRLGMGIVLDIVPNHMGIGTPENVWWWDVLTYGKESRFAIYFDIDWEPPQSELHGKVLVPVLDGDYELVLGQGKIKLVKQGEVFVLQYFDHLFPVNPDSLPAQLVQDRNALDIDAAVRKINANPKALDEVIAQQHYLLADWRKANIELNYRRFFSVADLAGLRMEEIRVFDDAHRLLKRWLDAGFLDGIRVDHPDGLLDPEQYLHRLRALAPQAWVVVEKITEPGENLPAYWPVAGTTGYDFLNLATGLFIDPDGEKALTDFYASFTGETANYAELVLEKKRTVLRDQLTAEVNRLTELVARIAVQQVGRKFSPQEIRDGLIELVASLPVYRTYIQPKHRAVSTADIAHIDQAIAETRERSAESARGFFDFLKDLLFLCRHGPMESEFVLRFQQLTGAAMAMGVENTAFYCFNRLLALNEVGGDPARFGVGIETFHEACLAQSCHWPNAMLATSTHDTKRSEDTRMRICLLSELSDDWPQAVLRWSEMNECHRTNGWPDRNAEYHFYQMLVGAWPVSVKRAVDYMKKAAWEANQHTNWVEHNDAYESALLKFVTAALGDEKFTQDLEHFLGPIVDAGRINSLAQTLVKLTAPGVPDVYQGSELWDFSLVDPDNRRPVDYTLRRRLLQEAGRLSFKEVWQRREQGLPKLWLMRQVLAFRANRPDLFDSATDYRPLFARGTKARHAVAFMRGEGVITVVPRLVLRLGHNWEDTRLQLPRGEWRNLVTGESVSNNAVPLAGLLRDFPVALLVRKEKT